MFVNEWMGEAVYDGESVQYRALITLLTCTDVHLIVDTCVYVRT